jgi:two-component system cell cycle sensor histidine kinase PleC
MFLTFDTSELKRLLDPIGTPTFVVDVMPDGRFRYAAFNRCNELRAGISHEAAVGRTPEELTGHALAARLTARYRQCVEAREVIEYEEDLDISGELRAWHTSLSPLFDTDGRVARILGTSSDITAIRAQQAALSDRESRLAALIEGSLQGILIHRHHRPLFCNAVFAQIFGYETPEELLAEPDLLHLVAPEERASAARLCELADTQPDLDRFARVRSLTRAGFPLWIELRARRIVWDGTPALQVTVVDVTKRKRYEDELIASKEILEKQAASLATLAHDLENARAEAESARKTAEEANRAKNHFLATMSHELRTPLNAILGFSEIIAQEAFGPSGIPQYADYAQDINSSGRHLLELINDILDIAKIEAGKLEIQPDHLDLDEVLEACRRLNAVKAHEREVSLKVEVAPGAQVVYADMRALKQILFNLLSNAIKFSERGGEVVLAARRRDDDSVEIAVEDHGIGIPAEHLERIFEPFHQLDNSYNRESGGTGLGLALVKALTELHGGTIDLASRAGVGTTVRLTFPGGPLEAAGAMEQPANDTNVRNRTQACEEPQTLRRSATGSAAG